MMMQATTAQPKPHQLGFRMEHDGGTISADTEEALTFFKAQLNAQKQRDAERAEHFPGTNRQQMTALCRLFPGLAAECSVLHPWDTDKFLLWAVGKGCSSGSAHAIRFVLQVWNSRVDWIDLLTRELKRDAPDNPNDRTLWKGLQLLKRRARQHLEDEGAEERKDGRSARVTEEHVHERLIAWFAVVAPFNVADAFSTWDEQHRQAFRTWANYPFFP
jgi:hypothetical protein